VVIINTFLSKSDEVQKVWS